MYVIKRFSHKTKKNALAADLLFLSFIAVCIGSSSVTIRVELRFVYVSFTASIIYLCYMCSYIKESFDNKLLKAVPIVLVLAVMLARTPIELLYRTYFNKIHCIVDLNRMNSLYDLTIGEYGLDDTLHKKKIYMVNNYYGMTEFYAEYFFKIYDKDNVGNKIILIKSGDEIPASDLNENTIILYEDLPSNVYAKVK